MSFDSGIQERVDAELRWAPEVGEAVVCAKVAGDTVTLEGSVQSLAQRSAAEAAARRVLGVAEVINDIQVQPPGAERLPDERLLRRVNAIIRVYAMEHADNIRAASHQGYLTLEGSLPWHFQRQLIEEAVRRLRGILSVNNLIRVVPSTGTVTVVGIEDALRRGGWAATHNVAVKVEDGQIVLRGNVRSCAERERLLAIAWSAPGARAVRNELVVAGIASAEGREQHEHQ